jgi:hypothetical protein
MLSTTLPGVMGTDMLHEVLRLQLKRGGLTKFDFIDKPNMEACLRAETELRDL